jgi:SAM-dependent methyltransferase
MASSQLYDAIGGTYNVTRCTEPRIAAMFWDALGDAQTVLNVGAGTGSYEPPGREVTAVEPSPLMRAQRPTGAAPCVGAVAECLPFADQSFDAAMAVSTVHHWQDPIAGLREMQRVARRVVVFTFDPSDTGWRRRFWLTRDYLPEVADFNVGRPSLTEQARAIGARIEPVLIPWDCADRFFEARAGGPNAPVTSSPSTRRSLASACSSPEHMGLSKRCTSGAVTRTGSRRPRGYAARLPWPPAGRR